MSIKKQNNINVEDITRSSQYDGMLVLRDVHDLPGHSLRVRDALTVVPQHYTHFDVQYNQNGQPTQVIYYAGFLAEISQIGVKPASSLNNTYFFLFEGRSNKSFYVWFNVDGAGVDPNIANSTGIEIPLNSSDPAVLVANAIELTLNTLYSDKWKVIRKNAVIELTTIKLGETNNTLDGNTTFIFSTIQEGAQQEVARVELDYTSNGDPIYEGQALRGHSFDIFSGKFNKNEVEVVLVDEQGSSLLEYNEVNSVAIGATVNIITYTVPASSLLKLSRCNVAGTSMGTFCIKVDGQVVDKLGTYYTDFNGTFSIEQAEFGEGKVIEIEVLNRGDSVSDFNANIQGRLLNV